jgi:hypothetical protein
MSQYRQQVVRAMKYDLLYEANPTKLVAKVNAALEAGAVFCGGPISNQGQLVQAVVWPEKTELVEVPDATVVATPAAPPASLEDQLRALGSDREGLSYDTHTSPTNPETASVPAAV